MPSEFLKCSICPKLPTFSDTSHLLTHVGSKGHLANLHKLQVKSHQEPEAAYKISVYNHWFAEHDVAQLLSERMLQKEAKQADKKVANERRTFNVKTQKKRKSRKTTGPNPSLTPARHDQEPSLPKLRSSVIDLDDVDYTPIRLPRAGKYPMLPSSPPRIPSSPAAEENEDNYQVFDEEVQTRVASSSPQLKGIRWPGMGLFDAATVELQKKRNQRKDGSVLKRLELLSTKVDPHETIISASGYVLKRRHMDNLENDSPVEGEFRIESPTPKRRRRSQSMKESKKSQNQSQAKRRPGRPRRHAGAPLADPDNLVTSETEEFNRKISRFSPTEDEDKEFKLAFRNVRREKKGHFHIYKDSSPSFGNDGSSEIAPSTYVDASTVGGQLSYPPAPWFQQQQGSFHDPFKLIRSRVATQPIFADVGHGKENTNPFHTNDRLLETNHFANPLLFNSSPERPNDFNSMAYHVRPSAMVIAKSDPFDDDDTFMAVRNPLAAALDHVGRNDHRGHFGHPAPSVFATQLRQPLFAP